MKGSKRFEGTEVWAFGRGGRKGSRRRWLCAADDEMGNVPPAGKGPEALCNPRLLPPGEAGGMERNRDRPGFRRLKGSVPIGGNLRIEASNQRPPLCKGRWPVRAGGVETSRLALSFQLRFQCNMPPFNPSVEQARQLPLHRGASAQALPLLSSHVWGQSLKNPMTLTRGYV